MRSFFVLSALALMSSYAIAQDIKITPDMYEYSPNSITGVYLCTPTHVLNGDCSDVDKEYYDNLARISLGAYEVGILKVNNKKTIAFKGPLSPGSSEVLIDLLSKHQDVETLVLSSQGGSEEEAYKIASYVKERGLDTWVPVRRMCLSACTPIFFSGKNMILDGQLGLHTGKFHITDPYLVRNLDAAKETIQNAIYENDVFMMKRVRLFLELKIPLSLIDSMIAAKGEFLVFTDLNDVLNYNPEINYVKSLSEMSEYSKDQPARNFDFQSYEQLH